MMHECPKCGFVQPQDRYCANCGLDIDNFKPAPPSLLQKLGKNTGLQIALVIGVVLALTAYIFISQKDLIQLHLSQTPQNIEALEASSENLQVTNDEEITAEESIGGEEQIAEPIASKAFSATAVTATPKLANKEKREIVIRFAEASSPLLQQLASEGQILNETAQRRSFTHTDLESIEKLKTRDPQFQMLSGGETNNLTLNNPILLDFTHISGAANDDVGLNLEITPLVINDTSVELNLTGQLHLKDENGASVASQEINANYVFSPKSTLLMVGFLPRQQISQDDVSSFSNTPLAIFESLQFMNGLTDFVIFIQIK